MKAVIIMALLIGILGVVLVVGSHGEEGEHDKSV